MAQTFVDAFKRAGIEIGNVPSNNAEEAASAQPAPAPAEPCSVEVNTPVASTPVLVTPPPPQPPVEEDGEDGLTTLKIRERIYRSKGEPLLDLERGSSNGPDQILVRIFVFSAEMSRELANELGIRVLKRADGDTEESAAADPASVHPKRRDVSTIRISKASLKAREEIRRSEMVRAGRKEVRRSIADTGQQVFGKRGIPLAVMGTALEEMNFGGWTLTDAKRLIEPMKEPNNIPDGKGGTKPNPNTGKIQKNRFKHSLLFVFERRDTTTNERQEQERRLVAWAKDHVGTYCHVWTKNTGRKDTVNFRFDGETFTPAHEITVLHLEPQRHVWLAQTYKMA